MLPLSGPSFFFFVAVFRVDAVCAFFFTHPFPRVIFSPVLCRGALSSPFLPSRMTNPPFSLFFCLSPPDSPKRGLVFFFNFRLAQQRSKFKQATIRFFLYPLSYSPAVVGPMSCHFFFFKLFYRIRSTSVLPPCLGPIPFPGGPGLVRFLSSGLLSPTTFAWGFYF